MSAIPCASVSLKTMADGTLRISFDFEPASAQDAFRLFAAPGTPAAIAALQVGYAAVGEPVVKESLTTEKPKGGPLAIEAAAMCRHPEYLKWRGYTEAEAIDDMRESLRVASRSEIDHDDLAKEKFIRHYRGPFMKYMLSRG